MNKKAFLVGINDYYPIGQAGQDLEGCVNDVRDMANTLVICGFKPRDILICTDSRATKKNIIKGLEHLVKNSNKNDSLVFYYSGHGSQVTDTNEEEHDYYDEVLCPHDMDFSGVYISDDEISKIISMINNDANLEVVLDCCHSGTATRQVILNKSQDISSSPDAEEGFQNWSDFNKKIPVLTPRYMEPPFDVKFHLDFEPNMKKKKMLKSDDKNREVVLANLNHSLWSGCRDEQLSYETGIQGNKRGIFTYNLCQILRRTNGSITRGKMYDLLNGAVQRYGYPQNPQLETISEKLEEKPFT